MSSLPLASLFVTAALAAGGDPAGKLGAVDGSIGPRVTRAAPIRTLNGFVENKGQWPEDVLFFAREGRIEATVFRSGLALRPVPEAPPERAAGLEDEPVQPELPTLLPPLFLQFEHQGKLAKAKSVQGVNAHPTRHHFIHGAGSASNCLGYAEVLLRDVAPGIDVRVRTVDGAFAYDLLAAPGADLEAFSVVVQGAEGIEALGDGALAMHTLGGLVEHRIGASWQVGLDGQRNPLTAEFRVLLGTDAETRFGFDVPSRDPALALVIDPSLVYATYVGGNSQEQFRAMAADGAGAVHLACQSVGGTPTTPTALQPIATLSSSAWVGKISADGTTLAWGTYLGGSNADDPEDVAVDLDGSVVVVGQTWSRDFPTTLDTVQPAYAGPPSNGDLFITRLDPTGSSLIWSTYLGALFSELASAVAIAPSGDVVVAADPLGASLPGTAGAFDPVFDSGDQMLLRLSADGKQLQFLTYFKTTHVQDIAIDVESSIYFAGYVDALHDAPIPTTPGAFKTTLAPTDTGDAYVAKLSSSGTQLLWATYLGGAEGFEAIWGIAVDAAAAVYVAGQTDSANFPVTGGAYDQALSDQMGGFVTKLLPGASGLVWSTYLDSCCGGVGYASDVDVDVAGNPHVAAFWNMPSFPTTPDAFQPVFIGPFPSSDAALTKLNVFGEQLVYSTWFGGSSSDNQTRIGLDASSNPHIAFTSFSGDLPVTPGAFQSSYAGSGGDMAVAGFELPLLPWRVLGGGLAGSVDIPNLAGAGALLAGAPTRLSVRGAKSSAPAWAVLGFSELYLPILGGTLVPWPDYVFPFSTSASGAIDVTFGWPGDFVPGMTVVFQFWVLDPGAPFGFSATNGLKAMP